MWEDWRYGFGHNDTSKVWIIAVKEGAESDMAIILRNYFQLSKNQMRILLS